MTDAAAAKGAPDMELTPERILAVKRALVRQYADQYGLEIDGWTERTGDGRICTVKIACDEAVVVSAEKA